LHACIKRSIFFFKSDFDMALSAPGGRFMDIYGLQCGVVDSLLNSTTMQGIHELLQHTYSWTLQHT